MKIKQLAALTTTGALLAGLLIVPGSAAEPATPFRDITDPAMAEAAEVLRVLGVVDGTGGGAFEPGRTLTRAEFCKMAVEIMGKGDQEPVHRGRTIFPDVKPDHWARGYINLATSTTVGTAGEGQMPTRLIMGAADGKFYPGRTITYGEAVTILMRALGYTNSDVAVGVQWYDGYITAAQANGLSDGLALNGGSAVSRGQTAQLFYNLLFTTPKDSKEIYLTSLGGREENGGVLLDVDAVAPDGTRGAVKTTEGVYKTDRPSLSADLEGAQGKILLDGDGKLLAFQPDEKLTRRQEVVSAAGATYVQVSSGARLEVKPETTVYYKGERKTYADVWQDLRPGTALSFCYTADGRLSYLFFSKLREQNVVVLRGDVKSALKDLTGGLQGVQFYKNGAPAGLEDARPYDVAAYDPAAKAVQLSDLRLSGLYENVFPNPETPLEVTLMGHSFPVLPGASEDLHSFKVGDIITLLLSQDGRVAGVVPVQTARSTTVGVVKSVSGDGEAVVVPLSGALPELSGKSNLSGDKAKEMEGQLVTVSSYQRGQISINKLSQSDSVSGELDLSADTLGGMPLAANVRFYDQVGTGKPSEVQRDQITCGRVPASKIRYARKNYAGKVDLLVFNDVTGDLYIYGKTSRGTVEEPTSFGDGTIVNYTTAVESDGITAPDGWKNASITTIGGQANNVGHFGGVAPSLSTHDNGMPKLAGYMSLKEIKGVRRSAFNMDTMTMTTPNLTLPVSGHIACYNKSTGLWFTAETPKEALNKARGYSDDITVYYDRTPETGGKVRIVVVG